MMKNYEILGYINIIKNAQLGVFYFHRFIGASTLFNNGSFPQCAFL